MKSLPRYRHTSLVLESRDWQSDLFTILHSIIEHDSIHTVSSVALKLVVTYNADTLSYRNQLVIHHLLEYMGSAFKYHHFQPMTNCCELRFLVGDNLLPSTGFEMNFLVKLSSGGISKFIM